MKLLYLISDFPYPSLSHAAARAQIMIATWHELGWDLTIACFPNAQPVKSACPIPGLRSKIHPLMGRRGFFERAGGIFKSYHHNVISKKAIAGALELARREGPFDAVIAEELGPARVALELKSHEPKFAKKYFYVAHNYESDLYGQITKGWFRRSRLQWLKKFERLALDEFDGIFAFSEIMKEQFEKLGPLSRIYSTSACFDHSRVSYSDRRSHLENAVFIGALHYHPNVDGLVWLTQDVLPHLEKKPNVIVAGSEPGPFVRQLCAQHGLQLVDTPLDMNTVLEGARVELVPLRKGSGVRGKILEAMAAGIPVVSTTLGAEGLPVTHGKNILLADLAPDFAARVSEILSSPDLTARLAHEGRALAESFDGTKVARRLADDVQKLLL